ncbi:hypothetical protein [Pseudomonas sp. CLCA07]
MIPLQAVWIGRRLREAGHVLRIIPAQLVKPLLKFNQDDSMMPRTLEWLGCVGWPGVLS